MAEDTTTKIDTAAQRAMLAAEREADRRDRIARVRRLEYWNNVWTPSRSRRVRCW